MSNPPKAVLKPQGKASTRMNPVSYVHLVDGIADVLKAARRTSARTVNSLMTATYWEIDRRIDAHEQWGKSRAGYGDALIERLSQDLTARFGCGFSVRNVSQMRPFYLAWPILQTMSAESDGMAIQQTPSATFDFTELLARYALDNLPNKVLAAEYRTVLPDEGLIAADLQKTRRMLEHRSQARQRATTRRKRKVE